MEATEVTNTSQLRQLRVGRYSPNTRRLCSSRISSAMLVRDRRTSSAKGAFGRDERQDCAINLDPNTRSLISASAPSEGKVD
jgi:hypothetical protein